MIPPVLNSISQAINHRDFWTNAFEFGNIDVVDGTFYPGGGSTVDKNHVKYDLMHEFGHTWDWSSGLRLSREMRELTTKAGEAPPSVYAMSSGPFGPMEDFAESFTAYLDPTNFSVQAFGATKLGPVRENYIDTELKGA